MAPVITLCEKENLEYVLVHTNQHFDQDMSERFLKDLKIRNPDYNLRIGAGSHGFQTGAALIELEKVMLQENPDIVLVQGDTNTTLAGALAAVKLNIPVAHIEAGLRSYDWRMPEEHNRRLVDHISSYLFAPTNYTREILLKENVWGDIIVTGNTIIDACLQYFPVASQRSNILREIKFTDFCLATMHRPENVDDKEILRDLIEVFVDLPYPVVFIVHPRTIKRLKQYGLLNIVKNSENIQMMSPVGYFDILSLIKACSFIITDSGGIQEEATAPIFQKYSFVIREKTDRVEAVKTGFAKVVGLNKEHILKSVKDYLKNPPNLNNPSPYGDGNAALRIIEYLKKKL